MAGGQINWKGLIAGLILASAILLSYASFGNNNITSTNSTTTLKNVATYFVGGTANGMVAGYSPSLSVVAKNLNQSAIVSNVLSMLEANGSVSNFVGSNRSYQVLMGNMNAFSLQQILYRKANPNYTTVNASAYLLLPPSISLVFYKNNQTVIVYLVQRNFTVQLTPVRAVGANVPVVVHALVTDNGTVYNNQLTVKSA